MLRRPFILSALAVTALLALAASAAHTSPLRAAGRQSGGLPSSLIDYTFTALIILAIVAFIVVAPLFPVGAAERKPRHPARALRTIGILVIVMVLIAFILRHVPALRHLL